MRLVKLSPKEFPEESDLLTYFAEELPSRNPPGLFVFPKGWIAQGELDPGETVLFSYRGRIRYIAKAATGRRANQSQKPDLYPNCLEINMESVRQTDFAVGDLEKHLRDEMSLEKCLERSQGWPRIPDDPRAERIVQSLAFPSGGTP
jgi:hypothetical protein